MRLPITLLIGGAPVSSERNLETKRKSTKNRFGIPGGFFIYFYSIVILQISPDYINPDFGR
jgi:hypothetical protein